MWLNTKKVLQDISQGTFKQIMLSRQIQKKFSKDHQRGQECKGDWSSLDYAQCIDEFMETSREKFNCTSIFDISLSMKLH